MAQSMQPELIEAWREVYDRSLVPAVVQSPDWLLAKLKSLAGNSTDVDILAATATRQGDDSLLAVGALTKVGIWQGFPQRCATTWDGGFLFSGMPLLEQSHLDLLLRL